jgi:hypothetical protein
MIVIGMRKAIRVGLCLWIATFLVLFVVFEFGRPVLYEVPSGLNGWFTVQYDDASCPPLATKGIDRVVPVSRDRLACTSSPMEVHWHLEKFEFLMPDGRAVPILKGEHGVDDQIRAWGVATNPRRHQEYDYIGPESEVARGRPPFSGLPGQPDRPPSTDSH